MRRLSRGIRGRGWDRTGMAAFVQTRLRARRRSCYCPCVFRALMKSPTCWDRRLWRYCPRCSACQVEIGRCTINRRPPAYPFSRTAVLPNPRVERGRIHALGLAGVFRHLPVPICIPAARHDHRGRASVLPAQCRTAHHARVALGASAFVDLGMRLSGDLGATRVLAYVASRVGFLGAGVILKEGMNIRGLNTAATIWCSADTGVCAGADRKPKQSCRVSLSSQATPSYLPWSLY